MGKPHPRHIYIHGEYICWKNPKKPKDKSRMLHNSDVSISLFIP
jgi:hypothetical protein